MNQMKNEKKFEVSKWIKQISTYRAGRDGEKCLKVLLAYVKNVVENSDEKYRTIQMNNKVFKTRVNPFIGAKQLLLAVGFLPDDGDTLVLTESADPFILFQTKEQLETAIELLLLNY